MAEKVTLQGQELTVKPRKLKANPTVEQKKAKKAKKRKMVEEEEQKSKSLDDGIYDTLLLKLKESPDVRTLLFFLFFSLKDVALQLPQQMALVQHLVAMTDRDLDKRQRIVDELHTVLSRFFPGTFVFSAKFYFFNVESRG
jgi:DNA polymerase sigma